MSKEKNFDEGIVPAVRGILRVFSILLAILIFVPPQIFVLTFRCGDPFFIPMLFHRVLLHIVGFKIIKQGTAAEETPVLFVSNHTSYLDIIVLGSLIRASFIAKAEVEKWPLFGFLSKLQKTEFIERKTIRAGEQKNKLQDRLSKGDSLILFPEGTSSDGQRIKPFKSSLFSLAEFRLANGNHVLVQPLSVVFTEIWGLPVARTWRHFYSWFGDMTLVPHLWRVLKVGRLTVNVCFYTPVTINDFKDRKELSEYCMRVISEGVERKKRGGFDYILDNHK